MTEDVLGIRIGRAQEYRERASHYRRNFEEERGRRSKEKAGEALWGVVSCLLNAIAILEKGKPCFEHRLLSNFAKQFLVSSFEDGEQLARIYKKVEKFHANFYHAFLDDEEFEQIGADIWRLVERLDRTLVDKLHKLQL